MHDNFQEHHESYNFPLTDLRKEACCMVPFRSCLYLRHMDCCGFHPHSLWKYCRNSDFVSYTILPTSMLLGGLLQMLFLFKLLHANLHTMPRATSKCLPGTVEWTETSRLLLLVISFGTIKSLLNQKFHIRVEHYITVQDQTSSKQSPPSNIYTDWRKGVFYLQNTK
jgi:hypothetical protein